MNHRIKVVALLIALIVSSLARADDCEDAGRMGTMLAQIDKRCPDYRLTPRGHELMTEMAVRVMALGGESCAAKGKTALLRELREMYPALGAAASKSAEAFNTALCSSIFSYLSKVGAVAKTAPLVEKRK
jgi:hypothetical protein